MRAFGPFLRSSKEGDGRPGEEDMSTVGVSGGEKACKLKSDRLGEDVERPHLPVEASINIPCVPLGRRRRTRNGSVSETDSRLCLSMSSVGVSGELKKVL